MNLLIPGVLWMICLGLIFGSSIALSIWDAFASTLPPFKHYIPLYSAFAKIIPRALVYFTLSLTFFFIIGASAFAGTELPTTSVAEYRTIQIYLLVMLMTSALLISLFEQMSMVIGERLSIFVLKLLKRTSLKLEKPS